MEPTESLLSLIHKSGYLARYPSWLSYIGVENKANYSPEFIARNDTIWEYVTGERGYLEMLFMMREIYLSQFPLPPDGGEHGAFHLADRKKLQDALFPGIDQLIRQHTRLFKAVLELHQKDEKHIVETLGPCLVVLFDDETNKTLSKLYGRFMFAQKRVRQHLQRCRRWNTVAKFLDECKNNPKMSRRSLEDCHMVIVQRWTKVETLILAIIKHTLNRPTEVENLQDAHTAIRGILKAAEALMTELEHKEKLLEFYDLTVVPLVGIATEEEISDSKRIRIEMQSSSTVLLNYAPLRVSVNGSSSQQVVEVMGIALNTCFFMLQKLPDGCRYSLYRVANLPAILWWGRIYGYFRKSVEKSGFAFFILLPSSQALTLFKCNTADELTRWETLLNDGFSQWREDSSSAIKELKNDLEQKRKAIAIKWMNTQKVLDLFTDMDTQFLRMCTARCLSCTAAINENQTLLQLKKEIDQPIENCNNSNKPSSSSKRKDSQTLSAKVLSSYMNSCSPSSASSSSASHFIADTSSVEELNQLFTLLQERIGHLTFAMLGHDRSGKSQSVSDLREMEGIPQESIRKNKTFSGSDSSSSKRIDRKQMKKLANREQQQSRYPSTINRNGSQSFKYPKNTNLEFTQLMEAMSRYNTTGGSLLQLDKDGNPLHGSDTSLSRENSLEALNLINSINVLCERVCMVTCDIRTENINLTARLEHLKADRDAIDITVTQLLKHGIQLPTTPQTVPPVDEVGGGIIGSDPAPTTLTLKQETEKLRQEYESFIRKSMEWEKKRRNEEDSIDRKQEALAKARQRLEAENAELARKQALYEENCKTLQEQINLYSSRGVSLENIRMPDPKTFKPVDVEIHRRIDSMYDNPSTLNLRAQLQLTNTDRVSQLTHENLSATNTHNDAALRSSLIVQSNTAGLPDHLTGSLLNEPSVDRRPTTPASKLSAFNLSNVDSDSALMRLAESSKSKKVKKSSLFRKH